MLNIKLLLPTYRRRYLFIKKSLNELYAQKKLQKILNIGTGEGDYDPVIRNYCEQLHSCDINIMDIVLAKKANQHKPGIYYSVASAQKLNYRSRSFDLVIAVDVIEHVENPAMMIAEIARVLKPGGLVLITYPNHYYPFTYDPVNCVLRYFGYTVSIGAYGYGHDKLIKEEEFIKWLKPFNFSIIKKMHLSKYLVGAAELYWAAIVQSVIKKNAANKAARQHRNLQPVTEWKEPGIVFLVDGLVRLDEFLCSPCTRSINVGFLLVKGSRL